LVYYLLGDGVVNWMNFFHQGAVFPSNGAAKFVSCPNLEK
jgi:hypothetical protein